MALALGEFGTWILAVVALLWTIDCFLAFYLALPTRSNRSKKGFLTSWKRSWLVKFRSSLYRINFDVHRAGGLWLWLLLLLYAWSSVYFTSPTFYTRVVQLVFDYEQPVWSLNAVQQIETAPPLEWEQALQTAQRLMAEQARAKNFSIERPLALYHLRDQGLYEYRVRSSLDIGDKAGATEVHFDSRSGELKSVNFPTGHRSGTTLTTWLVELHTANVFGLPYRILVSIFGFALVMLSLTGIYIWWKKLVARKTRERRSATSSLNKRSIEPNSEQACDEL